MAKCMTEFTDEQFGRVQFWFTVRRYPEEDGGDMYADWNHIYTSQATYQNVAGMTDLPNQRDMLASENLEAIKRNVISFLHHLIFNQIDIEMEAQL